MSSSGGKGQDPYRYAYQDAVNGGEGKDPPKLSDQEIMAALKSLDLQINQMKKPTGTRVNPARTCKDLFLAHESFISGFYWIDPNRGCREDAIEVYCNRQTSESCIHPQEAKAANATWYKGPSKHVYFGAMKGGHQFTYINDPVQLTFLRLLTTQARQNITYWCKDSVAVFDSAAGNTDKALKIMTSAENIELSIDASSKYRYDVYEDNCHTADGEVHQSIIGYTTKRTTRLPFIDVAPADFGSKTKEFGLDMGPVCFV